MEHKARKVLIADDEPDIRELLRYNLAAEGYEVWEAKNGEEALDIAKKVKLQWIDRPVQMKLHQILSFTYVGISTSTCAHKSAQML